MWNTITQDTNETETRTAALVLWYLKVVNGEAGAREWLQKMMNTIPQPEYHLINSLVAQYAQLWVIMCEKHNVDPVTHFEQTFYKNVETMPWPKQLDKP